MAEQIILDPSERAEGRTALDITPWLTQDGIDWGDASVQAYYSESQRGAVPVDYEVPNREISGGLIFSGTVGGTAPATARANIQTKLALFQREGGWLKRITNGGGTVYADVVDASFRATSTPGFQSRDGVDTGASFSLSCLPDFYEDEVTDSDNSTTTARELIFTTALTGEGDSPQRVRTVVDNDSSSDWRGLIWAYRSRHYSPDSTAQSEYEAEELDALDTAYVTAGTAVYGTAVYYSGGTIVHHGTLASSWTPVLGTDIGGTTSLDHTGTYQVFGRLLSTSGTTVQARFLYDVGDLIVPTENAPWRFPGEDQAYIADLGEIRLDPAPVGTHRWRGQVQFMGDSGGETASVDKLWIVNKDEGMGVLTAPPVSGDSFSAFLARSQFTTESGAINGDADTLGNTWASTGDATDVSVGSGVATRSEVSDVDYLTGRYVISGLAALAAQSVSVDFKLSTTPSASGSVVAAVLARYSNTSNWLWARVMVTYTAGALGWAFTVGKRVAGTYTSLGGPDITLSSGAYYTIRLTVGVDGSYSASLGPQGAVAQHIVSGRDSVLGTGGTLASGKPGFYDANTSATAVTRTYDNFAVWAPDTDAVIFDAQSAQLTTDGIYREDAGGTAYGPVSRSLGDLPRFPVPQQSGGTVETILIPSTGDLDQIPDTIGTASISARNYRRPSWLFVDGT